ncbi:MAG: aminopeptidase P family protein [Ruminococcaceae bacterium]|nr:aminopeptidase P family protein [Oscillospiraceae bacterium]
MNAIQKLQQSLPEHIDALLVTCERHQRYLTGLNYTDGYVLVSKSHAWLLADFRYIEVAKRCESDDLTVVLLTNRKVCLGNILADYKLSRVGYESAFLTCGALDGLKKTFPLVDFVPCGGLIEKMREYKTAEEVSHIVAAQRIAEQALERLLTLMTPSMTEIDVALELDYGMRKLGAEKPAFDTIAVSGSASSLPHGEPRNIKLEKGFLTMDFGALVNGYCSDMTRTIVIGKADDEMKKVYHTVLDAQLAALDFVAVGKTGAACDKVARDRIDGAGYEGCFGHSLGHGVGMFIHEEPRLSFTWEKPLEPGQIVTVEPGIYIEGKYGVRIEDMVWLTEEGAVNLTKAPKDLIELF